MDGRVTIVARGLSLHTDLLHYSYYLQHAAAFARPLHTYISRAEEIKYCGCALT